MTAAQSPTKAIERVYVLAGEPSGDAHAAKVIQKALQAQPELQFRGMGGDELAAQNVGLVEHISNTSIMGFLEVFAKLGFLWSLFRRVKADILAFKPDRILLVDYPGFNLRLAKWARKQGIPVDMYISPQVWAWKKHRVHQIARDIDRLSVILPFEPESYEGLDIEVEYVGHPLVEPSPNLSASQKAAGTEGSTAGEEAPEAQENARSVSWRKAHGLPISGPILALLPGSRPQEILRMLPILEQTAQAFPDHCAVVAGAPGRTPADYATSLPVLFGSTQALYAHADVGVVTSGTATLEAALAGLPQVVAYQTSGFTYRIAKAFSRVKYISLVNLILDREAVPERIQEACSPSVLVSTLKEVMSKEGRAQQKADQAMLRAALSKEGASQRVAKALLRPVG